MPLSQNVEDRRTKKELLELLDDSETRNRKLTEVNEKLWKEQANRNRPKPDAKFKIEIFGEREGKAAYRSGLRLFPGVRMKAFCGCGHEMKTRMQTTLTREDALEIGEPDASNIEELRCEGCPNLATVIY